LLSKLDTAKAAALLGQLPGPVARRITYAISQTGRVTPEAVDRIGWSLAAQLDARPILAFADRPEKRVGNILNQSAPATRDQMMSALDEEDATFASSVRKVLFTFTDIPARLSPRDVPAVVRVADQDQLILALAAATEGDEAAVAEFLLANMSTRMADNLRDEIRDKGKVKRSEGEAAMTALVGVIRGLADDGTLQLIDPDEDSED
ncbi:MAG TPA: flagellar motor switch protein FliG, partial [Ruegeria sp.]|nr:flagellar motor switch protein FliG [Ruegeria sp.]